MARAQLVRANLLKLNNNLDVLRNFNDVEIMLQIVRNSDFACIPASVRPTISRTGNIR
jgi:hypothetical protein